MKEREISLVDLIVEILLRWRIIIAWMVVGGILMGIVSCMNSYRAQRSQISQIGVDNQVRLSKDELQQKLTVAQLNNINYILDCEEYVAVNQAYLNESILMNIDAMQVPFSKLTFVLTADDIEQVGNVVQIYQNMITGDLYDWLEEQIKSDYTAANYSEVIYTPHVSSNLEQWNNSFSVNAMHLTKELSVELANLIVKYVNEQEERLQEELGSHTVEVIAQSFAYVVDSSMMTQQRKSRDAIITYTSAAEDSKRGWSSIEEKYYQLASAERKGMIVEESEVENIKLDNSSVSVSVSVDITYVLLGMMLFAFVVVLYLFLRYLLNKKLRATDDVKEIYNIEHLGLIPGNSKERKRFLGFVDKWILKIRNSSKRKLTKDESIGLAEAAIKIAAQRDELSKIFCVGCEIGKEMQHISEQIQHDLGNANIEMVILDNVLFNQEAMEQLNQARGAFLMEKAGETTYADIAKELELLHRQRVKVLGIVVVG